MEYWEWSELESYKIIKIKYFYVRIVEVQVSRLKLVIKEIIY